MDAPSEENQEVDMKYNPMKPFTLIPVDLVNQISTDWTTAIQRAQGTDG